MSEILSFLEKRELTFLERKLSSMRMSTREETGKKKPKKSRKLKAREHLAIDWDNDLWD